MSGQQDLAWETQDGVRSLQAALNSQPPVPMPLVSWDTNTNSIPKLEGLDTIVLSTAPLMRSSPPVARPTILPQRSLVVTHPYSTPMGEVHQSHNPPQYVNLDGELLSQSPHSGKRVRVKSREKSGETGEVRPCKVCGEKAGKHSYYGGEVCPSCRAFFRRSVQSGYNATYCCVRDGNCEVTLKTRKNCQYCRYKLCLACGMKTTWVLTEEERKQKFEGRTKKKRNSDDQDSENVDGNLANIADFINEEEMLEVNDLVKTSGYYETSKVNDMETSLIRDIIRMVAFSHQLPQTGQKQLKEVLSKRFKKIAKKLREFQLLSFQDKEEILNQNIPFLVEMQICTFFNPDLMWREQFIPLMGREEVDKLDKKLKSLNVAGLDDLQVQWRHMFSQPHLDTTMNLQEVVKEVGGWAQDAVAPHVLPTSLRYNCEPAGCSQGG